ncbi:UNKNOWN [Stylonychia lemnae]|uniref:Uncharacterized protein n=1 Tax=Stylonychia lemnae TaxID=5949 RepID=A0A078B916_STYLE|nr:UNKNOWN [Stylonychia lemnae]|eukprot:CDW90731.1 UNKNOWN [Stylonychia lemnae]
MMMDPYYRVKSDIHQRRPAYGILMAVWTVFMATLAGYFGYYAFNIENKNQCFVKDDESLPISPIPVGITEIEGVIDVSREFDQVISIFFLQSVTGSFIGFYHVLSIFLFPILLKFSYPVGLFNKLNLVFGVGCLIFMHLVRFGHGGKVCSGDYLPEEVLDQGGQVEGYLVIRGNLMSWYVTAFWIILGVITITVAIIVIAALKSYT